MRLFEIQVFQQAVVLFLAPKCSQNRATQFSAGVQSNRSNIMAYIPPHKRQAKGFPLLNPTPAPDFLMPNNFRKSVNLKSFGEQNNFRGKTIVYRKFAVSKWFSVGLADYSRFSSLVSLQPFSADYFDGNPDRKALSLVLMEGITFFFFTGRVVLDMYVLMYLYFHQFLVVCIFDLCTTLYWIELAIDTQWWTWLNIHIRFMNSHYIYAFEMLIISVFFQIFMLF